MRIDVHAHYYPTAYVNRMASNGADVGPVMHTSFGTDDPADVDARLKMMDDAGVEMQVLSVSATHPYLPDKTEAVAAAHQANDLYAEAISRHPRRFKGFVCVPLPHVDEALKELERGIDQLGMVGATLGTSVMSRSSVDELFEPFYAELNRRAATLFIHPAGLGLCSPLLNDHALTWPIGATFEDTMFACHVLRRQIPERYPKIKIIVPHLGGALPMLLNRLDATHKLWAGDSSEPPSTRAKKLWYDVVAQGNTRALKLTYDVFGADRLLYGSDYPYQLHERYTHSVKFVEQAGIPKADTDNILDHNAAHLLGLEK